MNPMRFQNVRAVLAELEDDARYRVLEDSDSDERFHAFRQGVENAGIRCLQYEPEGPTVQDMEERLQRLHALCVAGLAPFAPFIARAKAALHA